MDEQKKVKIQIEHESISEENKKLGEEVIEKIDLKKKLPREVQYNINKEIFKNLMIAVGIMLLICCYYLGFRNIEKSIFITDLKFFALLLLAIAIALFEKCYRKDNGKFFIQGVEFLIFAIMTLFLPYLYFECSNNLTKFIVAIFPTIFAGYYGIKSVIIAKRMKKQYQKENNDIKDIVKKEDKRGKNND